ncbi:MAG: hypothetical protein Q7T12_00035 [Flavobacterium sp.]|nr:hypothetical protein [Flavobacterium sp.]
MKSEVKNVTTTKNEENVKGTGKCTKCTCEKFSASDDDPDICTCGHLDYQHKK